MGKIVRKFILLFCLMATLGITVFTDLGTTASNAAPCCSSCWALLDRCELMEPGSEQDACYRRAANCLGWCGWSC